MAALCISVSESFSRNALHVQMHDNISQSLINLNDTARYITTEDGDRRSGGFVVAGGALRCFDDNLECRRWRQSCQVKDLRFSVTV